MNTTCPKCQMDNAFFDVVDKNGAHYCCPDCDYEWVDKDSGIEEEE